MNWNALIALDQQATERIRLKPEQKCPWRVSAILAHSGDSWFWLLGIFLIWLFSNGSWHNRAALLAGGIVALAVTVFAVKLIVRRRRPEGEWGGFYRKNDPLSFPSGHSARAALLAVMAAGLGPAWFAIIVILWFPLVSLARVLMGVHYLSDVIAGAALGLLAGFIMLEISPLLISLFPFLFIP
jgi:undecaprenyl-diphosphatase